MSEFEDFVIYEDELQTVWWQDSSSEGMVVKFRIPSPEFDSHPFKRFPIGTRFYVRMVEIGDDDQPVDQAQKEKMRQAIQEREVKGGKLARDAGILCCEERFQRFVVDKVLHAAPADKKAIATQIPAVLVSALKTQKEGILDDPRFAGELSKWWLYSQCGIKSRRELDHKQDAANRYQLHVIKPYMEWKA